MKTAVLAVGERRLRAARRSTLLDLVLALSDSGASDKEVVWAVVHLVNSGRVGLIGQFCQAHLQIN